MSSPSINFRLSEYQLARGLYVIRQLEPAYQFTSFNDIVKTIYHDYLAKMNLARSEEVPMEIMAEISDFIAQGKSKGLSLDDMLEMREDKKIQQKSHIVKKPQSFDEPEESDKSDKSDESVINSVSDFSPPEDWK